MYACIVLYCYVLNVMLLCCLNGTINDAMICYITVIVMNILHYIMLCHSILHCNYEYNYTTMIITSIIINTCVYVYIYIYT